MRPFEVRELWRPCVRLVPLLLSLSLVACATVTSGATGGRGRGPTTRPAIAAADLAARVAVLAHDSMAGREAGTPAIDRASRYLARELGRLGLQPAGDNGTFLHAVPLQRKARSYSASLITASGTQRLGFDELVPGSGIAQLPEASRQSGAGQLVYAGHFIDPTIGTEELVLSQLRDAAVIVRLTPPPGVDAERTPPRTPLQMLLSPASPAAAILLVAEGDDAEIWTYAAEIARKGALSLASSEATPATFRIPPIFFLTPAALERLLGVPLDQARSPRTDLGTFEYSMEERIERVTSHNVVAVVRGSDPTRAAEYVALGAHYDHVGIGLAVGGDSIYNGADDNASGTAALLEVAEALAALPPNRRPARSTLIVFNTAEESGLLGSEYFTDYPTVPREAIIAHINLDMIGRNHPDTLHSVGSRRISTELGDVIEAVNGRQPRPFVFDFTYDAPNHPEAIYCRSDHYNYARFGIPILFLTTGLHEDYHAPSDEAAAIDGEKGARVASLVYEITTELGNRPTRPRLDQPVPPLGTPCT